MTTPSKQIHMQIIVTSFGNYIFLTVIQAYKSYSGLEISRIRTLFRGWYILSSYKWIRFRCIATVPSLQQADVPKSELIS